MMIVYANDELSDEFFAIIKMIMKTYFVDELKVNMLIENDVLVF